MAPASPLSLDTCPRVAIAIQDAIEPELIRAAGPDMVVELRLDALADQSPAACCAFVRRYAEFPLLATLRRREEGGAWKGTEVERRACYSAVLPLVQAIDVEIGASEIVEAVMDEARAHGKLAIGSFHDFQETPNDARLEEVHTRGRSLGADVVKVAARCNSSSDLQRLAAFTLAHRADKVIVIGMGAHGLASRVFFPALGSLLTYTFLGDPTAPGQLNCTDTLKYLDVFYPQGCG